MEKRPSTYLRCYIPGYTSKDRNSRERTRRYPSRRSSCGELQRFFENIWQNLMKDATREVYGGLALLGILCLNAGIFLMVCRSKSLITEAVSAQIAEIAGPLIIALGLSLFVSSVIVYKRKKRRTKVCFCCDGEQDEEIIPYYMDNGQIQYLDGESISPSSTLVHHIGSDDEEIRSAFRKFSRDHVANYNYCNYSLPYVPKEIPFEVFHCKLCTDYSQKIVENGYINGCGCLYCTDWAGCVEYPVPQVTLV